MADMGEHIKFRVRFQSEDFTIRDVNNGVVAGVPPSEFIGEYICAALNEKHQRDMADTVCANCGLPGEAPWKPCKDGFDHQWKVVEGV